jgi:phosphoribosylformylglycinamidine synthase
MSFKDAGLELYLLGATDNNMSGTEWAYLHNMRGGTAPIADLAKEMRLIDLLLEARPIFSAAHDLSQGGLASTLIEMVLRYNVGAKIDVANPGISLLSETPGRVLVAIKSGAVAQLQALAAKYKIEAAKIGITGGTALVINGSSIGLDELRKSHTETFKKLFG